MAKTETEFDWTECEQYRGPARGIPALSAAQIQRLIEFAPARRGQSHP